MTDDAYYLDHIYRGNGCAFCGGRPAIREVPCEVCGRVRTADGESLVLVDRGFHVLCGPGCLARRRDDVAGFNDACPLCGGPRTDLEVPERACAACASVRTDGYLIHLLGRRPHFFCDASCLDAWLRRENPYCG